MRSRRGLLEPVAEAATAPRQNGVDRAHEPVLQLQRTAGNAAVSRLIQRKDGPASTDAPGAHHKDPPKKAHADIHARVLKFDIDADMGRVVLSAGTAQGAQVGMEGSMLDDRGSEYVDFAVEVVGGATCEAHVHATQDQINRGPNAIIKASKFESQEGKEF